jgi:hypothetical protein
MGKLGQTVSNIGNDLSDLTSEFAQTIGLADRPQPQPAYYQYAPPQYYQAYPGGYAPAGAPPAGHTAYGVPAQGVPVPPPGAAGMPPPTAAGAAAGAASAAAEAVPTAAPDAPDFDHMSVGDLKQFIASRGAKLEVGAAACVGRCTRLPLLPLKAASAAVL